MNVSNKYFPFGIILTYRSTTWTPAVQWSNIRCQFYLNLITDNEQCIFICLNVQLKKHHYLCCWVLAIFLISFIFVERCGIPGRIWWWYADFWHIIIKATKIKENCLQKHYTNNTCNGKMQNTPPKLNFWNTPCFDIFKGALSGLRQFLATENPLKIVKNVFLFHKKSFFHSQDI